VALLETRGRVSGNLVSTAVGFVEEANGSLVVAAGSEDADWALNLRFTARCTATIGERTFACEARELSDEARSAAIRSLILKYGTPAERLGRGPAFLLQPVARET